MASLYAVVRQSTAIEPAPAAQRFLTGIVIPFAPFPWGIQEPNIETNGKNTGTVLVDGFESRHFVASVLGPLNRFESTGDRSNVIRGTRVGMIFVVRLPVCKSSEVLQISLKVISVTGVLVPSCGGGRASDEFSTKSSGI